ncbi:alcohol dehydrogenase catalytic domain-containing protein [Actinoplanes sp. TBRC 11911]|uniref:alcohol dehydrogenase catalytic domain-containing protein n=1 Tax=Actinoplanes sp. TBRC 11911 TaxID=2729386 RepID=UPI00145C3CD7|nr:alcohol dehydrogenase catalytic domain-containing protein [Actinoplanes sp. TBRC 11911]NMO55392.1 alcohol dehydrogenase catalytic domain-containing protein [Actinoplanes sp. TBRC 11911]
MTASMRVVQAQVAGKPFVLADVPVPDPGPGKVRVKVHACGVCAGDEIPRNGFLGTQLPRVPGHEIAGVVDALGDGVDMWNVGDRVGVGWFGGSDLTCDYCRRGDFLNCVDRKIVGSTYDGGYAQYMVAPQDAVARMPEGLDFPEAAPMMCAGVTAFNALRRSHAGPGDLIAIHGFGGLGHLAVQFARAMGFRTVAISRGRVKQELARRLGADEFVDSTATDPGDALHAMGGAVAILDTVSLGGLQSALVNGLKPNGQLLVLEGLDPIHVTGHNLVQPQLSISGRYAGHARDSEETLNFAVLRNIRPIIETYPLDRAEEAFENLSQANLRSVLLPQ